MRVLPCLFDFLVSAAVLVIADPGIIQLQETSIDASQLSVLEMRSESDLAQGKSGR